MTISTLTRKLNAFKFTVLTLTRKPDEDSFFNVHAQFFKMTFNLILDTRNVVLKPDPNKNHREK